MIRNFFFILRSLASAILVAFTMYSHVCAQQNNSLYFMDGIPQSNQLNPATQPRYSFYIGIPALSSIEFNMGNSSIGLHDIISSVQWFNKDTGNLIPNTLLGKFSKNNFVSGDFRMDLLSFGFRVNDSYISFSVGERIETYGNLPYGLLDFAANLNSVDNFFDLSGLGINATWYREYALGYSIKADDKLTFGIRGKLLFGLANFTTRNYNTSLNTIGQDSIWQLQSNIQVNSSIPGMNIYYTGNTFDSASIKKMKTHDYVKILTNTQNPGFGIDLGIIYKLANCLSISASVIDLGFIQWHSNVNNMLMNASYSFPGFNVSSYIHNQNQHPSFLDTLKKAYTINHDNESYITNLSGKIFVGAYLQPLNWIGLGALSRTQIRDGLIDQQYTLSMNLKPGRAFNFNLAYTITDNTYDNFGVGFYFTAGVSQFYIMSDRIPLNWYNISFSKSGTYFPLPYDEKSFNFHFGWNLVFGNDQPYKIRRLKRDKPLVEVDNQSW